MRASLTTTIIVACALSACATAHVTVTHIGTGQGAVISKTCDGAGLCVADNFINCPAPMTPLAPSDTPSAAVDRPGCFADVGRQHRLDPAAATANDRFTSFGGSDTQCSYVPQYCVVEERRAGEVFVSFARPPFPEDQRFDLTVEVEGAGAVTNDTPTTQGCGLACRGYTPGRIVTLIAQPPPGGPPTGVVSWTGCYVVRESNGTSRCVVLMDATKTVRARFVPRGGAGGTGGSSGTGGGAAAGSVGLCGVCTRNADCAPSPTGNPGGTVCHNGRCEEECNKPRVPLCFVDAQCRCMQDTTGGRHACPADPIGGGTSTPAGSVGLCGGCRANAECSGGNVCHNGRCEEKCTQPRVPACFIDAGCECKQDVSSGRRDCP